ncbi:MAG: high-affinity iron transporter, partial [Cognaticolwellia sp.]
MLINTVILFLRDALPIFVISIILISMLQQESIKLRWY